MTDLKSRFQKATQDVRLLSQPPEPMQLLRLYSLFKQATDGDCTGSRPSMVNMKGRYKYDAWKALEGTSKEDAMQQYIEFVESLLQADKPA